MHFGKVIGTVWATQKHHSLVGEKMQLVQPLNAKREPVGKPIVALDSVGAGAGETVLYVTSSEAATPIKVRKKINLVPTDATIVGIVDSVSVKV
ncbi:MAG: EutN/CcmL family microcompartment protein [Chloroherpetonaceae bacterium]|nr:EutN/CcmL family microcompartment protein [Chloroherpetonaceae bacterium]MDW8436819.1 EutN/CcmL family microcompartment protein [Chloroherpetonaceae bacterium]